MDVNVDVYQGGIWWGWVDSRAIRLRLEIDGHWLHRRIFGPPLKLPPDAHLFWGDTSPESRNLALLLATHGAPELMDQYEEQLTDFILELVVKHLPPEGFTLPRRDIRILTTSYLVLRKLREDRREYLETTRSGFLTLGIDLPHLS